MTPETGRLRWRKSSRSGGTNGNCVELAHTLTAMRDSKNTNGPALAGDVSDLLRAIREGRLEL
jgi:hypothetical protein